MLVKGGPRREVYTPNTPNVKFYFIPTPVSVCYSEGLYLSPFEVPSGRNRRGGGH